MAYLNVGLDALADNAAYGAGSFSVYGNTYIVWGTDWITTSAGLIVVSATFKDRIIDFSVEQGAGFTAMFGMLMDGKDCDIEAVDTTFYPPWTLAMNPFQIVSPTNPTLKVILTGNSVSYAKKREGLRTANFKSFTAFDILTTTTIL